MTAVHGLFAFDAAACRRLAARSGTPCFVYREELVLEQLEQLRSALPSRVRVAYAVKANPHPKLLHALARAGTAFDCASLGELDRLQALGVPGSRISFAGPGKRDHEIEVAVNRCIRLQAEGLEDLERVEFAARRDGRAVAVNLRVQPRVGSADNVLGGCGPTAFGVDEEDLDSVLDAAGRFRHVAIRGLHGFVASGERDAAALLAIHAHMLTIAERMRHRGIDLQQVNLGGGLGVPYDEHEQPLDLDRLGRGLDRLLDEKRWFGGDLVLEPGRFLAAPCGVYLSRVVRTKLSRGEHFAVLDGGIHHLLRPVLTGQPFPVRLVGRQQASTTRPTTLAGPLCTALDRLGRVDLPPLRPGDLLAFGMVGAYGATEAMSHFLDHPPAPEIWVGGARDPRRAKGAAATDLDRVAALQAQSVGATIE